MKKNSTQNTKESDLSGMKRNGWLDCKNGNGKTKAYNELSWWIMLKVAISNSVIFKIGKPTRQKTDAWWSANGIIQSNTIFVQYYLSRKWSSD